MLISKNPVRPKGVWPLILLLGVALAACSGSQAVPDDTVPETAAPPSPVAAASPTGQQPKQLGQESAESATALPETDPVEATLGSPTPIAEPATAVPANPEPTPFTFVPSDRTALVSTSPAEFNIAAGQLQFVEFMAFW